MSHVLAAVREDQPGTKWLAFQRRLAGGYDQWFLKEGDAARPSYLACRQALETHMPELVSTWERLVDLAGGGDRVARLLALWCPTPYLTGCSQAVWIRTHPLLVRNYDYSPRLWDGVLLRSCWLGEPVLAMSDSLWGALDGVNGSGLAVSLAFGGRRAVGEGFGMPLILRYILETCRTTREATAVLTRVPSHMSYNVTVLDADGHHATVFVAPDRPAVLSQRDFAVNHQRVVEWEAFVHATSSLDRERMLASRLQDPHEGVDRFVARFLEPPLFSTRFDLGWGTLYTAVYDPSRRSASYRWPGARLDQSIERFHEAVVTLDYSRR